MGKEFAVGNIVSLQIGEQSDTQYKKTTVATIVRVIETIYGIYYIVKNNENKHYVASTDLPKSLVDDLLVRNDKGLVSLVSSMVADLWSTGLTCDANIDEKVVPIY